MELLATLGQYLLLTFVLPGCCYAVAFALGCPDTFRDVRAAAAPPLDSAGQKVGKGISQGYWLAFIVFTGGLLLSSVCFAIELLLRYCSWFQKQFPPIDFAQILDKELSNLFTAMAFMHFNIGAGLLIILIGCLAMCKVARRGVYAAAMIVLVIANISVSSHLFRRVDCMVAAKKDSKITVPECLNGKSPRTTSGSSARQP